MTEKEQLAKDIKETRKIIEEIILKQQEEKTKKEQNQMIKK